MHHTHPTQTARKVRLWPGLRLELCGQGADTSLTPDEALGLANVLLLEAREAIAHVKAQAQPGTPTGAGLAAHSTRNGVVLDLRGHGFELAVVLTREQLNRLMQTTTSPDSSPCAAVGASQPQPPAAS